MPDRRNSLAARHLHRPGCGSAAAPRLESGPHGASLPPPPRRRIVDRDGHRHRLLLTGEETGGAYALLKLSIPPGIGLPAHVHANEDEVFHIVEGSADVRIGDERFDARAGSTIVGPRGVPHAYTATSKDACRMLVVVTPAGFERFFRELPAAKRNDPAAIAALVGRYGIAFVS